MRSEIGGVRPESPRVPWLARARGVATGAAAALTGRRAGRRAVPAPSARRPANVLILYASFGAGHEMAARALEKVYRARGDRVRSIDALAGLSRLGGPLRKGFLHLTGRLPHIYGFFFGLFDRLFAVPVASHARHLANRWLYRKLVRGIVREGPDTIVAVHYLQLDALARARRRGTLRSKIAVVITDWTPHTFWLDAEADRYYVAGTRTRAPMVHELLRRGVAREKIVVTGIPVDPALARIRPEMPARPTVLVMMGGYGAGAVARAVKSFAGLRGVRLEVVAGRNEPLRAEAQRLVRRLGLDAAVHGFVEHGALLEIMARATVVVSKPGGITFSEATSLGKPLVLVGPAVGQEAGNARAAVDAGAAVLVESASAAGPVVGRLLDAPGRLEAMAAASRSLGNARAAYEVVADIARL